MTRDEAIKIKLDQNDKLIAYGNLSNRVAAEHQIDTWVALGMLKLDEADEGEIGSRLLNACHGVPYLATCINETLAKAGLMLVKK